MGVEVKGPGGVTIVFPDGTDPETINRVMRQAVSGARPSDVAAKAQGARLPLDFDAYTLNDAARDNTAADLKKPVSGRIQSLGLGFAQGASADFADEASNLIGKAQQGDGEPIDFNQALFGEAWRQRPTPYAAGYVVGSAVGAPGRLFQAGAQAVKKGAPAATRMGNLVRQGAAGGALAGSVAGAGIDAENRLRGALVGGATGGAFGVVAPVVGSALSRAGAKFPGAKNLRPNRAVEDLADRLQADGVKPADAERLAREWMARAGATTKGGKGEVSKTAMAKMEKAGRSTPALVDLAYQNGWRNTLDYLENLAGRYETGKAAVAVASRTRADQRAERMLGRLDDLDGRDALAANAEGAKRAIKDVAREKAAQAYAGLDDELIPLSPTLQAVQRKAAFQEGVQEVLSAARAGDLDDDLAALVTQWVKPVVDDAGNVTFSIPENAPARVWQEVVFGMRDAIKGKKINPAPGQALSNQRLSKRMGDLRSIVKELREASPSLKQGDFEYRLDMGALGSVDIGKTILKPNSHNEFVNEIRSVIQSSGVDGPEMTALREAALEQIAGTAASNRATLANKLDPKSNTFDPRFAERLKLVFGDNAERTIGGYLDEASRTKAVSAIDPRTGSPTARRLMTDDQAADFAARAANETISAVENPVAYAMKNVLGALKGETKFTEKEVAQVMQIALDPYTPKAVKDVLNQGLKRLGYRINPNISAPTYGATLQTSYQAPRLFEDSGVPSLEPR